MHKLAALLLALLLAACGRLAPAESPAQLRHTPGPPVTITRTTYTTTVFTLELPANWRVITSASFAPVSVVLVRPDEMALMLFSVADDDIPPLPVPPADGEVFTDRETLVLPDGTTLYAALRGPSAEANTLRDQFAQTVASLRDTGE